MTQAAAFTWGAETGFLLAIVLAIVLAIGIQRWDRRRARSLPSPSPLPGEALSRDLWDHALSAWNGQDPIPPAALRRRLRERLEKEM